MRELPYTDCSDLPPAGCFKHAHGNRGRACLLCPKLNESKQFTSTFTGLTYNIRHNLTCKSTYTVYLVTCQAWFLNNIITSVIKYMPLMISCVSIMETDKNNLNCLSSGSL